MQHIADEAVFYTYHHALFGPLLQGSRFWRGWCRTGGNVPWRSEESPAFFGFDSEQNSRGKPDLAGKLRQSQNPHTEQEEWSFCFTWNWKDFLSNAL